MTGGRDDLPGAAVTVDVVVLTVRSGRLHCLLAERDTGPEESRWELPGSLKVPELTLEECATGRVEERYGLTLDGGHVEQLATYGDPGRDPRGHVISVAYLAFVPGAALADRAGDPTARFWAIDDLDEGYGPILAFDHERILADGVERARAKLEYTTLATRFVPDPFTVSDLYEVYRAVWGVSPGDKANFSRKVKNTDGFMVETARTSERNGRGRPSMLFRAGPATNLHPPILRPLPVRA